MSFATFFGHILKANSKDTIEVPEGADLVITQFTLAKETKGNVGVFLTSESVSSFAGDDEEDQPAICVAQLSWQRTPQTQLQMVFPEGDVITFEVKGDSDVHIVGHMNISLEDSMDSDEDGMEMDSEEVDEAEEADEDEDDEGSVEDLAGLEAQIKANQAERAKKSGLFDKPPKQAFAAQKPQQKPQQQQKAPQQQKPQQQKPQGGKPQGGKPQGGKPQGGKPQKRF